jgi:hypothetical protein
MARGASAAHVKSWRTSSSTPLSRASFANSSTNSCRWPEGLVKVTAGGTLRRCVRATRGHLSVDFAGFEPRPRRRARKHPVDGARGLPVGLTLGRASRRETHPALFLGVQLDGHHRRVKDHAPDVEQNRADRIGARSGRSRNDAAVSAGACRIDLMTTANARLPSHRQRTWRRP